MEAYKGNSLVNLQRSLEIISRYPSQVIVLKGTKEIIPLTYKPLKRIRTNIVDYEQTESFPEFCSTIYSLNPQEANAQYRELQAKSREANAFFVDKLQYASKILEAIALTEQGYSQDELHQIRRKQTYSAELLDKIIRSIMTVTAMLLSRTGLPNKGFSLVKNCYLFRYTAACFFLSTKWISEGGYQSIEVQKFQNDVIDMSYTTYATYFDGLLTKDKKIKEIHKLLEVFIRYL